MQVEWATAGGLGVQVHLEGLAHRVGLDEVALIVDVEAVLGCVILQIGDESGDVDYCHLRSSRPDGLPQQGRRNRVWATEPGPRGAATVSGRRAAPGGSGPVGC